MPRLCGAAARDDGDERAAASERDEAAAADPALERLPAVRERIPGDAERRRPHDRPGGVVEEKRPPRQAAAAGEHRAEHAQSGDEPRDEYRLRAVTREEAVELREARAVSGRSRGRSARQAPRPPRRPIRNPMLSPSTAPAMAVTITQGSDRVPEPRQRGAGQQHRFARDRQPGVLEQDADEHHGVPVAGEQIDEPCWHRYL